MSDDTPRIENLPLDPNDRKVKGGRQRYKTTFAPKRWRRGQVCDTVVREPVPGALVTWGYGEPRKETWWEYLKRILTQPIRGHR